MKIFFKRSKTIIVMKKEDWMKIAVIVRYAVTLLIGLLSGANSETVQTLLTID